LHLKYFIGSNRKNPTPVSDAGLYRAQYIIRKHFTIVQDSFNKRACAQDIIGAQMRACTYARTDRTHTRTRAHAHAHAHTHAHTRTRTRTRAHTHAGTHAHALQTSATVQRLLRRRCERAHTHTPTLHRCTYDIDNATHMRIGHMDGITCA
jgi:hypothetical protein